MSVEISRYCHVAQASDVGCKRAANEDACGTFECPNGLVAVVCDGMGGHVGGAVASQTAVAAIRDFLTANYFDNPAEAIIAAVNAANAAIIGRTRQQPELSGMGSTCVMLIVRDGRVWYGIVGDSRIYLVSRHTITQLTKDQSYVQMLVDAGQITKEEAEHHPRKNEITNALGLDIMRPAEVCAEPVSPQAGDCFVLCSDGLSGMVPDTGILDIVSRQAELSQQKRVDALIRAARDAGGLDNITCQIVEFSVTPSEIADTPGEHCETKTKTGVKGGNEQRKRNKPLLIFCLAAAAVFFVALGIAINHFFFSPAPREENPASAEEYMQGCLDNDAKGVALLTAKGDSAVEFKAGAEFASVCVSDTTVLKWRSKSGKMMEAKIPAAVNVKNITIEPRGIADTMTVRNEEYDEQIMFRFSDDKAKTKGEGTKITRKKMPDGKKLVIIKIPAKDKNYYCVFEVNMPKKPANPTKPQEKKAEKDVKETTGTEPDAPRKAISKTISNVHNGSEITIHNGAGTNTDTRIYIGKGESEGLSTKKTVDGDGGWYTINCVADGEDCVIRIKNIQAGAKGLKIDIPVNGGEFILCVNP